MNNKVYMYILIAILFLLVILLGLLIISLNSQALSCVEDPIAFVNQTLGVECVCLKPYF